MKHKAIVLFSGGLDSILAAKLMMELGFDVECLHYLIKFAICGGGADMAAKAAKALGAPLRIFDITDEYLEMFKKPEHGYGANVNPCIDCKIFMLKKAKKYMEEHGGAFLVTGEVLGERPMSQRRDALNIIEKCAGVRGILVRPLSAKLLEPTVPEKEGIIDRERLLDIRGRGRKPQIALAARYGVNEYPQPSGGCLLADPGYANRVQDLFAHGEISVDNLLFAKEGRQYRLSPAAKLAVGRDQRDNDALAKAARPGDACLKMKSVQGPFAVVRGAATPDDMALAARIVAYHTKFRNEPSLEVECWRYGSKDRRTLAVAPASLAEVEKLRL